MTNDNGPRTTDHGQLTNTHVIFKVGGSLLTLPGLADRLRTVLNQRPRSRALLIAGGGGAADLVREWDCIHRLDEERAHWLALRAMTLNEALLGQLLPEAQLVTDRHGAQSAWNSGRLPVLAAVEFLRSEEDHAGDVLPHTWDVTSDSIAAWVAARWPANELLLLKSAPLPDDGDVAAAPRRGLVDAHFSQLADRLPAVGWVNLRDEAPRIEAWLPRAQAPAREPSDSHLDVLQSRAEPVH